SRGRRARRARRSPAFAPPSTHAVDTWARGGQSLPCPASLDSCAYNRSTPARRDAMLRVAREPGSMGTEQAPPERPDVDQTLKRLLLRAHDGFLALVAPGLIWRGELSPELPAVARRADLVWEVE